jgi:hypothetical protein
MKSYLNNYLKNNSIIIFSPFLILYSIIVLKFSKDTFQGDERRYYEFANNILNGFYSPPAPDINLWSGPGYPLFLVPFVWLESELIIIKLANAVLQYLSVVLLFQAINKYVSKKYALIFSFSWAFYYISYQELYTILTEPLTSFLSSLILYLITKINTYKNKKMYLYSTLTALALGFLALTKIIFGYVLLCMLIFYFISLVFKSNRNKNIHGFLIIFAALLCNMPYLSYTHNLTGKLFYWGNSGGSSLYWMSTPVEGEFGEWNNASFTANCGHDLRIPCNSSLIAKNHQKNMDIVSQYPTIHQDDELKRMAIENIKNYPLKYIRNYISNFSRLFFGVPNSYFYQREQTIWRILPNSIVFTLLLVSLVITIFNYKSISFELKFIVILTFIYLSLSLLVSAYPRQLYVVIPLLFFWFAYILKRSIVFNLRLNT